MADNRGIRLDANEHASRTVTKPAAFSWPFPVDRRLDQLVEVANGAGAGVRRNELAAAIIAAAPQTLSSYCAWSLPGASLSSVTSCSGSMMPRRLFLFPNIRPVGGGLKAGPCRASGTLAYAVPAGATSAQGVRCRTPERLGGRQQLGHAQNKNPGRWPGDL